MSCRFVFSNLLPVDQIQLGLCCHRAKSNFWRGLGSKLWYKSKLNGRIIRKLCISLPDLYDCSANFLDNLTCLYVAGAYDANVQTIMLPKNLTYCSMGSGRCWREVIWPISLQVLELSNINSDIIGLHNHTNLRVLRMRNFYDGCQLPPNLTELALDNSFNLHGAFPQSLTKMTFTVSNISQLPTLPNLNNLNIGYLSAPDGIFGQTYPNVRHLSFKRSFNTNVITNITVFFPNVTDLDATCGNPNEELPVFHLVRQMRLTVQCIYFVNGPVVSANLDKWSSLQDLTLILTKSLGKGQLNSITLSPHLAKLHIKTSKKAKLRLHVPASVMQMKVESCYPAIDVSFHENAKLQTLRTIGNVFLTKIKPPKSLRLFHVRLASHANLIESWESLGADVDFQVIYE